LSAHLKASSSTNCLHFPGKIEFLQDRIIRIA
jgi:hypothetical protein